MSCNILLRDLGYSCYELADGLSQLVSPFCRADDGELVSVYIQELREGYYRVRDAGGSLSHMLTHGIKINSARTDILKRIAYREGVELSAETGEIFLAGNADMLTDAVNRIISMSLEVGHYEFDWLAKERKPAFKDQVGEFLDQTYKNVQRDAQVKAFSGHQLTLSFVIHGDNNVSYIEAVGRKGDGINWPSVYKTAGLMADLREHDVKRCVIIDDADDIDTKQAIVALSEHASVLSYSKRESWYRDVA